MRLGLLTSFGLLGLLPAAAAAAEPPRPRELRTQTVNGTTYFHARFGRPAGARHGYLSLHLRTTLVSTAPRATLEPIHRRVVEKNMVLGALRGIPRTDELIVEAGAD